MVGEFQAKRVLHIGGPKTGSSAIQSWLAINVKPLSSHGFDYVFDKSFARAEKFGISSGNGHKFTSGISISRLPPGSLWSNETLLLSEKFRQSALESSPDDGLKLVGYFRNPIEWASSAYLQMVKRHNATYDFDYYLRSVWGGELHHLNAWLKTKSNANLDVRLFNYDRLANVVRHFALVGLGIENLKDFDFAAESKKINRSLHPNELILMLQLNREASEPKLPHKVSDFLVEAIPEVKAAFPLPSIETYEVFLNKHTEIVSEINSSLDIPNRLVFTDYEGLQSRASSDDLPASWFEGIGSIIAKLAE